MALILKSSYKLYNYLFHDLKDERTANYPFVDESPLKVVVVLTSYALLCKYGPKIMKNREAFELRSAMTVYNFIQVLLNTIVGFVGTYYLFIKYKYNFSCQPIDYSSSEHGMAEVNLAYAYFLLKMLDLLDTVFIVLKKKDAQLSFLHCYHHFGIMMGSFLCVKFIPGGPVALLGVINTFVHSIMYCYYYLTAFNPELKKSIWWKKHITQIQLIQFMIVAANAAQVLMHPNCNYPKIILLIFMLQNLFMLVLFGDFYRKVYLVKKQK